MCQAEKAEQSTDDHDAGHTWEAGRRQVLLPRQETALDLQSKVVVKDNAERKCSTLPYARSAQPQEGLGSPFPVSYLSCSFRVLQPGSLCSGPCPPLFTLTHDLL